MSIPTSIPPATAAKVQQIQATKETAKQQADAAVMTDEHAVHSVVTPWKSKPTGIAALIGAVVGFPFGGPLGSAAGAAIGATVEHYLRPVSAIDSKLGLLKTKVPAGTPSGPVKPAPTTGTAPAK